MLHRCLLLLMTALVLNAAAAQTPSVADTPCHADLSLATEQNACHDWALSLGDNDREQGMAILDRLCQNEQVARACSNLAYWYDNPLPNQAVDAPRALVWYERGCRLGDGVGCNNLANLLLAGRGTEPNEAQAVRYIQRSCELDYAPGCFRAAVITQRGLLLARDDAQVERLLDKGCALGDAASCHDLGYLYFEGVHAPRDQDRALALFAQSCDMGLPRGCGTQAWLYMQDGLTPQGRDDARAIELGQRACAGNDAPACTNLGHLIEQGKGVPADPARALPYYIKACAAGHTFGCGSLGVLMAQGRGTPPDETAALPYLQRGCSDEHGEACAHLALLHQYGRAGLPKSAATANYFRRQACANGDRPSCTYLLRRAPTLCTSAQTPVLACRLSNGHQLSLCATRVGASARVTLRYARPGQAPRSNAERMRWSERQLSYGPQYTLSLVSPTRRFAITETLSRARFPAIQQIEVSATLGQHEFSANCTQPIRGTLDSAMLRQARNVETVDAASAPR